ncbi:hypothetical protein B9Z48_00965 [Limnohabitans sp. WS1]|nr:hypothetical protein B9Z48_00965 [Limnohabitans sp. WS1]
MGDLWEPRPRGDGWWSTRHYRGEGAAPTKKAFMQTSSGRINRHAMAPVTGESGGKEALG